MTKSEKKLELAPKLGGSELVLRDGTLNVEVHPLGNVLTYYLLDKHTTTDDNGNTKHNNYMHMLDSVIYGIRRATLNGKALPMETQKVAGKTVQHLRGEDIEVFTMEELGQIAEAVFKASNLTEPEKNA